MLQADAYAGYNALFRGDRLPAPMTRALSRAEQPKVPAMRSIVGMAAEGHARRKFFELADVAGQVRRRRGAPVISPIAVEAVRRIAALFDIERAILGKPAAERQAARQELSLPLVTDLGTWLRGQRAAMARHNPVAAACDYLLKDWPAFTAFLNDGSNLRLDRTRRGRTARRRGNS